MRASLAVAILVALLAAACGNDDDGGGGSARLVFTDPAETIEVSAPESFFIDLAGNATTGFSWQVTQEPDSSIVKVVSSTYVEDDNDDDRVGVGGTYTFELEAVGAGETTVGFTDVPPGEEPSGPADETFTIQVTD